MTRSAAALETVALAHSVVDHLYRTLLGREPEPEALAFWGNHLEAGGSVHSIYLDIQKHARAARATSVLDEHPLAPYERILTLENMSYFTFRGKFRPPGLTIETINICNNDCVICPYSSQTRRRQTMTMDLFKKVVDDYVRIGGGLVSLTPMVGEVFLDKMLRERLMYLRRNPAITRISAISNASMVRRFSDAELAEILSCFDRLSLSLYGLDPEEYAAMTRKADYEETRTAIARILSLAGPEKIQLGARQLKKRDPSEIDAWLRELADRAGIAPDAIRFASTTTYANWSFFDTGTRLPFDAAWTPVRENTTQCGVPLAALQVLSDGTVSFCACANFDGDRGLVLGNAAERSLGEMLESDAVRKLWNWAEHGVPEFCRTCSFHIPLDQAAATPGFLQDPFAVLGG